MIENVLSRIGGVAGYGLFSICLFFAFFTGLVVWSLRLKKPYLDAMQELPLRDDAEVGPKSAREDRSRAKREEYKTKIGSEIFELLQAR